MRSYDELVWVTPLAGGLILRDAQCSEPMPPHLKCRMSYNTWFNSLFASRYVPNFGLSLCQNGYGAPPPILNRCKFLKNAPRAGLNLISFGDPKVEFPARCSEPSAPYAGCPRLCSTTTPIQLTLKRQFLGAILAHMGVGVPVPENRKVTIKTCSETL